MHITQGDDGRRDDARTIAISVVTAALTSLATGLVTLAIDELKERLRRNAEGERSKT